MSHGWVAVSLKVTSGTWCPCFTDLGSSSSVYLQCRPRKSEELQRICLKFQGILQIRWFLFSTHQFIFHPKVDMYGVIIILQHWKVRRQFGNCQEVPSCRDFRFSQFNKPANIIWTDRIFGPPYTMKNEQFYLFENVKDPSHKLSTFCNVIVWGLIVLTNCAVVSSYLSDLKKLYSDLIKFLWYCRGQNKL